MRVVGVAVAMVLFVGGVALAQDPPAMRTVPVSYRVDDVAVSAGQGVAMPLINPLRLVTAYLQPIDLTEAAPERELPVHQPVSALPIGNRLWVVASDHSDQYLHLVDADPLDTVGSMALAEGAACPGSLVLAGGALWVATGCLEEPGGVAAASPPLEHPSVRPVELPGTPLPSRPVLAGGGHHLVVASSEHGTTTLRSFRVPHDGRDPGVTRTLRGALVDLVSSTDGRWIGVLTDIERPLVLDAATLSDAYTPPLADGAPVAMALSSDGALVATATDAVGVAAITIATADGQVVDTIDVGDAVAPATMAFSDEGLVVAVRQEASQEGGEHDSGQVGDALVGIAVDQLPGCGRTGTCPDLCEEDAAALCADLCSTNYALCAEPPPEAEPPPPDLDSGFDGDPATTERVAGATRGLTSVAVSLARYPDGQQPAHVVLASGLDFADALAGTPLLSGGPLLLNSAPEGLEEPVADELRRVLPDGGTVYLLGGTTAVSASAETEVEALGYTPVRLAGPSRVETAVRIAEEVRRLYPAAPDVVIVARAFGVLDEPTSGWADSVTVGGWAAAGGIPVLVTTTDEMHPAAAAALRQLDPDVTYIIGGQAALSPEVEAAAPHAVRISGSDRAATAAAVATDLWGGVAARTVLVNAYDLGGWLAALPAAGISADHSAPTLVVDVDRVPPATAELLSRCGTPSIDSLIVGTTLQVADATAAEIDRLDGRSCPQQPPTNAGAG